MSKIGGLIILFLLSTVTSFAQIDTTSKPSESLAFDFGFTRGKNVNLWPILKKYKDNDIKETQVLFSIYSKTIDYKHHTKHFQFYPFIVSDSSAQNRELRIGTTYYPNLLHYYRDSTYKSFKFFELAPNISCLGISKSKNGLFVDNNILFFLWYKNDVVKGKKKIIVFPTYWYWADSNTTHHLVFPLVYSEKYHSKIKDYKSGLYTDYTQSKINIGLLFKYENRNNHTLKTRLFPIYWSKMQRSITDTTYRKTLFPIYFSYSSDNKNNKVLFPIVWSYNNLTYKSFTLFPIFSYGHSKDSLQKEKHLNIVGLYNYSKEFNTIKNRFFPLYWSKTEFHGADTSYRKTIFPLYFSYHDHYRNNKVLFPLIWSYKNSHYQSFTVFPLFSVGHSTDSVQSVKHLNIFGVYSHYKNTLTKGDILFPIYWSKTSYRKSVDNKIDTSYSKTIFPLYFSYKDNSKNNKVLFPLVWSLNSKYYQSLTVFPLFSVGHSKDSAQSVKHLNILGLYTHLQSPTEVKDIVLPLFWSKKTMLKNDTVYRKTLFPIYFSYQDKLKHNTVVFPFVWKLESQQYKSLTVFPLFSVGHSKDSAQSVKHLNILGLYTHLQSPTEVKDVVLPLYWSKKTLLKGDTIYRKKLFPIYFSYKDKYQSNNVLFPLVYKFKSKTYQSLTVFPLFSVGHSMDSAQSVKHVNILGLYTHIQSPDAVTNLVLPFYWSKNTFSKNDTTFSKTVFPLYWSVKNKHFSKSTLFPIYWSYKDSLVNNKVVFPLVWSLKNKQYTSFTLAPLFSVGHSMDSARSVKHLNILGIYTHVKNPTATKDIIFPLYWNTTTYYKNIASYKKVLFPVYWSKEDTNSSYKVLFPLVWQFRDKYYKSFTLFPLFSVGHSLDSAQKLKHLNILGVFHKSQEDNVYKSTLFPIYWHKAIYDKKDTTISSVIFPLYWAKKDKNINNKVFFPVVWSLKNKERNRFTIFPLFSVKTEKDTSSYENTKSFLLLYKHTKTPYFVTDRVFPIYWSKTYISKSDTSYSKTIFPIYFSSKGKNKNNKVLFPLVWSMRNKFYNSFTLFPLVSFGKSTEASSVKSKHFMLSPLLGYFKENNIKKLFLFPLFSAKSTDSSFKFNVLYFLYRQKNTPKSIKISALWPLCEYEKSDSVKRFRFAPIYWYKKTDSTLLSSIQPLYYYNKTPKNKTFIFAWFLYRHDNEIGVSKSNSILWKVYNKNKYQNGDYETRFLHLVYANVHKDGKVEKSIFPIYHKVNKANGEKSLSVLFGFYNHYRQYKPDIQDYYEEERLFWILRLRSNYNQLKQAGKAGNLRRGK